MSNTGGPAFPGATYKGPFAGMTLRDYFAAKAMQGLISNSDARRDIRGGELPQTAYKMADAMLKAREQK